MHNQQQNWNTNFPLNWFRLKNVSSQSKHFNFVFHKQERNKENFGENRWKLRKLVVSLG